MLLPDWAVLNAAIDWLSHGFWDLSWWQIVLYTLCTTHITIASVTIYLHRHQAHRAMDLHVLPTHFFRFWLWVGTGQVTKEWVSIHRKHHAKCETVDDPHSPVAHGIKKVFWQGAELYRLESKKQETLPLTRDYMLEAEEELRETDRTATDRRPMRLAGE